MISVLVIYLSDITNVSLSEQAFQAIRRMIVTLELAPGAVVREDELQQQLGLGRTPIREALQRLVRDQFVTIIPRRGMYVSSIDVSELSTLYETRAILEPYVMRLASRPRACRPIGTRWPRRSPAPSADSTPTELLEIDRECREIVWAAAGNRFLTETLDMLYAQSDRLWHLYLADVAALDRRDRRAPCDPCRARRRRRRTRRGLDRIAHARLQRQDRRRRSPPPRVSPRRLLTAVRRSYAPMATRDDVISPWNSSDPDRGITAGQDAAGLGVQLRRVPRTRARGDLPTEWICAGVVDEMPATGSWTAHVVGGLPVLFVRDKAGDAAGVPQRVPASRFATVRGRRDATPAR